MKSKKSFEKTILSTYDKQWKKREEIIQNLNDLTLNLRIMHEKELKDPNLLLTRAREIEEIWRGIAIKTDKYSTLYKSFSQDSHTIYKKAYKVLTKIKARLKECLW